MAGHSQFKNIMHRKGRADKVALQAVRQARARNHGVGQARHARPGVQSAPARGHHRRPRREHAEGQYRARHQEGARRRRRELRRDPLRGLRAGRRRRDRRGARPTTTTAPPAKCARSSPRTAAIWRDRRGVVHVRSCRRGRIRRQGGERRRHAGSRDRGRRRGRGLERRRPSDLHHAGNACRKSPRRWRRSSASRARRR